MQKPQTDVHARPAVIPATRVSGRHRLPAPSGALRGRAVVVAVAAGASVSAAYAGTTLEPGTQTTTGADISLLAQGAAAPSTLDARPSSAPVTSALPSTPEPVLATTTTTAQDSIVSTLLAGTEVNTRREIAEEQARRPKVVMPAQGSYTSNYAMRWGSFHGGVDIAAPLGTPIVSATDGTVIDSGPAQGFGQWVRVKSDDGIMTVYGHVSARLVQVGQRVTAGQPIALMGNEGFSTGSHLHFEVWVNDGKDRIDPEGWLREHGLELGPYVG